MPHNTLPDQVSGARRLVGVRLLAAIVFGWLLVLMLLEPLGRLYLAAFGPGG